MGEHLVEGVYVEASRKIGDKAPAQVMQVNRSARPILSSPIALRILETRAGQFANAAPAPVEKTSSPAAMARRASRIAQAGAEGEAHGLRAPSSVRPRCEYALGRDRPRTSAGRQLLFGVVVRATGIAQDRAPVRSRPRSRRLAAWRLKDVIARFAALRPIAPVKVVARIALNQTLLAAPGQEAVEAAEDVRCASAPGAVSTNSRTMRVSIATIDRAAAFMSAQALRA